MKIINGSSSWGNIVPDDYAMKCVYRKETADGEEFIISFVNPCTEDLDAGFCQGFSKFKVPNDVKDIVVAKNDICSTPYLILMKNEKKVNDSRFLCNISDEELNKYKDKMQNNNKTFKNVIYCSVKNQKSDEDAPEWLKNMANVYGNVVYFKL